MSMAELSKALAKAQMEFKPILRSANNPHLQNKYADLAEILNKTREALSNNGLAISQPFSCADGQIVVQTVLLHESGGELRSEMTLHAEEQKGLKLMQALGSAITYARRYQLAAILGVAADDDDDGEGSSGIGARGRQQPKRQQREPWPEEHSRPSSQVRQNDKPAPSGKLYTLKDEDGTVGYQTTLISEMAREVAGVGWTPALANANVEMIHALLDDASKLVTDMENNGRPATKVKAVRRQINDALDAMRRVATPEEPETADERDEVAA